MEQLWDGNVSWFFVQSERLIDISDDTMRYGPPLSYAGGVNDTSAAPAEVCWRGRELGFDLFWFKE